MKRISDNLNDVDSPVKEKELVLQILNNLPDSYNSIIDVITNKEPFPSFSEARNMLLLHENRESVKTLTTSTTDSSIVLYSNSSNRSDNGRGRGYGSGRNSNNNQGQGTGSYKGKNFDPNYHLRKHQQTNGSSQQQAWPPHTAPPSQPASTYHPAPPPMSPQPYQHRPPVYYAAPAQFQPPHAFPAQYYSSYGPHASSSPAPPPHAPQPFYPSGSYSNPPSSAQPADLAQLYSTMTLQPPDDNWYMDTGATAHMTHKPGILNFVVPNELSKFVVVGNGATMPIPHVGHTSFPCSSVPLSLNNVLVAPSLVKNLIYVRQFTRDNNVSIEFDPSGFSVKGLKMGNLSTAVRVTVIFTLCSHLSRRPPPPPLLSLLFRPLFGIVGSVILALLFSNF